MVGRVVFASILLYAPLAAASPAAVEPCWSDRAIAATGDRDDLTPPEPPRFTSVTAEVDELHDHVTMAIAPSSDTELLAIEIREDVLGAKTTRIITTRIGLIGSAPRGCAGFLLRPAHRVCFAVRAIDIAGNQSAAVEQCTEVRTRDTEPQPIDHYGRPMMTVPHEDPGPAIVLCIVIFATFVFGLRWHHLVVSHVHALDPGASMNIEVARGIANRARALAIGILVASIGGLGLVLQLDPLEMTGRVVLAEIPLLAIVCATPLAIRGHRAVRAIEAAAIVTTLGCLVFVTRDGRLVTWLRTSPEQLARAAERAVPVARVL